MGFLIHCLLQPHIVFELEPTQPEFTQTIMSLINGYCLFLVLADTDDLYAHLPVINNEPLPHPSLFHPLKDRDLTPPPVSRLNLLRSSYIEKYDMPIILYS